jgi:hypothetical protein
MDFNSLLGGLYAGADTTGKIAFSFNGLAVQNEEGRYLAYEQDPEGAEYDRLVDVTEAIIDGLKNFLFWFPVEPEDIVRSNLFVVSGPDPLFYFAKGPVNKHGIVDVLDPQTLTSTTYVAPDNLLGFQFFNMATSLVPVNGIGGLGIGGRGTGGDIDEKTFLLLTLLNNNADNNALTTLFLLRALGGRRRALPELGSRYPGRKRGRGGLGSILPLLLLSGQQGGTSNALLPFLLAENLEEEEEEEEARGPEPEGRPEETRMPEPEDRPRETRGPEYRDRQ